MPSGCATPARTRGTPSRSRTRDLRLRKPCDSLVDVNTYTPQALFRTQSIAQALLEALNRGEQPDDLADQLADAVLDNDLTRIALEVRDGGPHAWRRAIELAALVLAAGRAGAGRGSAASSG